MLWKIQKHGTDREDYYYFAVVSGRVNACAQPTKRTLVENTQTGVGLVAVCSPC